MEYQVEMSDEAAAELDSAYLFFLHGTGRKTYRIVFTIFDTDAEVRILHFRHAGQQHKQQNQEDC